MIDGKMLGSLRSRLSQNKPIHVILHIGTHKTATTSLQTFLQLNASTLRKRGVSCAAPRGVLNANFLLKDLSRGEGKEAQGVLRECVGRAQRSGGHTIVLSAEALYAMTAFCERLRGNNVDDYWSAEAAAVGRLRAAVPDNIETSVVCYFRRQDTFLESIYNQSIKASNYSGSISDFRTLIEPALDYARHLSLWRTVFPDAKFVVRSLENLQLGVAGDFLSSVLALEDRDGLVQQDLHINERLGRDVLEYKRLLNQTHFSKAERHMNAHAVMEISRTLGNERAFDHYLDSASRAEILADALCCNGVLVRSYGMQPFPEINPATEERAYPGLTQEKANEIHVLHQQIKRSFSYRCQLLIAKITTGVRRRSGVAGRLLDVFRQTGFHRLLK